MNVRRAHVFQHVPFEDIGNIAAWLQHHHITCDYTRWFEAAAQPPEAEAFDLLIVMGGPMSVHDTARYPWLVTEKQRLREAIQAGKYVLGICLGAQLVAEALGAEVTPMGSSEIGWFPVQWEAAAAAHPLLNGLAPDPTVFHWHGEAFSIPPGAMPLASSEACATQGLLCDNRVLGLQYHMETTESSFNQLMTHCHDPYLNGPFIQDEAALKAGTAHVPVLWRQMHQLLDNWLV